MERVLFYTPPEDPFTCHIRRNLVPDRMTGEWVAASFTLRQGAPRDNGTLQMLTRSEVKKCTTEFLKVLNKEVSGPAYRRFDKRLAVIPVMESKNGRLHVHMLLERPARMGFHDFADLAIAKWTNLRWSLSQNDIKPLASFEDVRGWVDYILKDTGTDHEVLDIHNLYLPWERDQADKRQRSRRRKTGELPPLDVPKLPSTRSVTDFYTFD